MNKSFADKKKIEISELKTKLENEEQKEKVKKYQIEEVSARQKMIELLKEEYLKASLEDLFCKKSEGYKHGHFEIKKFRMLKSYYLCPAIPFGILSDRILNNYDIDNTVESCNIKMDIVSQMSNSDNHSDDDECIILPANYKLLKDFRFGRIKSLNLVSKYNYILYFTGSKISLKKNIYYLHYVVQYYWLGDREITKMQLISCDTYQKFGGCVFNNGDSDEDASCNYQRIKLDEVINMLAQDKVDKYNLDLYFKSYNNMIKIVGIDIYRKRIVLDKTKAHKIVVNFRDIYDKLYVRIL